MPAPHFKAEDIARIRTNLEGYTPAEWAAIYQVGLETVRRIIRYETYSRVGDNPRLPKQAVFVDPIQASIQRVILMSGQRPTNSLTEEPTEAELDQAASRLANEAGGPANQLLEELLNKAETTGALSPEELAAEHADRQARKSAEPPPRQLTPEEEAELIAALKPTSKETAK